MAGGPITPSSIYLGAASGNLFPNFYTGGGSNASPTEQGIGVVASLGSDAVAMLRFPMPPTIPSGTLKLRNLMLANATSGTIKYTVSDINVAATGDPSNATMNSETQSSATWSSSAGSTADDYIEVKTTLTSSPSGITTIDTLMADTPAAFSTLLTGTYSSQPNVGSVFGAAVSAAVPSSTSEQQGIMLLFWTAALFGITIQ
ncbi:unnamed protein product [Sphagnum balticum]